MGMDCDDAPAPQWRHSRVDVAHAAVARNTITALVVPSACATCTAAPAAVRHLGRQAAAKDGPLALASARLRHWRCRGRQGRCPHAVRRRMRMLPTHGGSVAAATARALTKRTGRRCTRHCRRSTGCLRRMLRLEAGNCNGEGRHVVAADVAAGGQRALSVVQASRIARWSVRCKNNGETLLCPALTLRIHHHCNKEHSQRSIRCPPCRQRLRCGTCDNWAGSGECSGGIRPRVQAGRERRRPTFWPRSLAGCRGRRGMLSRGQLQRQRAAGPASGGITMGTAAQCRFSAACCGAAHVGPDGEQYNIAPL